MGISTEQRLKLTKELAKSFAKASGYDITKSDISNWDVAIDALIKAVEGIVEAELRDAGEELEPDDA